MVKITADLIQSSYQYRNPLSEWELCLGSMKISIIENMGCTQDQFDSIDFSNNEIRKLDGFSRLTRVASLNFTNNKIMKIGTQLSTVLPRLHTLILINNSLQQLSEIDKLSCFEHLEFLVLTRNPISCEAQHYRLYVISRLPALKFLDFQKVSQKERDEARKMFPEVAAAAASASSNSALIGGNAVGGGGDVPAHSNGLPAAHHHISRPAAGFESSSSRIAANTATTPNKKLIFIGGTATNHAQSAGAAPPRHTSDEEIRSIYKAIDEATSMEEITRLRKVLQSATTN